MKTKILNVIRWLKGKIAEEQPNVETEVIEKPKAKKARKTSSSNTKKTRA